MYSIKMYLRLFLVFTRSCLYQAGFMCCDVIYPANTIYVWCEVQKDCIRLFEKGIRTEAVDDSDTSAFIVFSPDSTQLELFFSNNQPNEILERRSLPSGGYAWNVEDDDTKNVRLIDGLWTISQRDKLIYTQKGGS